MGKSVKISGLAAAISEELKSYQDEVTHGMKKEVSAAARECKNEIVKNAPKLTGDYKKSWQVKKAYESAEDIRFIIHSQKEYRIAHLLEHGHAKINGGRVEARPHIAPAAQKAEQRLMKKVKVLVRGGKT